MLLILLLPLGRHWRLFSFGEQVEGWVGDFKRHEDVDMFGETQLKFSSEVHFRANDSTHLTLGPIDQELKKGESITVFYRTADPSKNCIFNFACLYLTYYTILPVILIFVWWAFYLSYNNYRKQARNP